MPTKSLLVSLVLLSISTGCAQTAGVPVAEPFPDASLRKAKSAEHWNVIAGDVASQTAALRDRPDFRGKPLYVERSGDNSTFSQGFHSMLIAKLVNNGMTVATRPESAIVVRYEAQVVRHLAGQGNDQPGTAGANARLLSPTNTEVIISTSMVDNNRLLMRKTDVYYVEDVEGVMFEGMFRPQTRNIGVVGK